MKKIQLNLKKRDRDNLKSMSNTYEDTHMKESSKLEEDVNPDVFLMNLQVKNKDNAHLFNMDFSEFLPTVQKKESSPSKPRKELESVQEQVPSHLMIDIEGDSFSFLDKLDKIDRVGEIKRVKDVPIKKFIDVTSINEPKIESQKVKPRDTVTMSRSYSRQSTRSLKNPSFDTVSRSYSKHSIKSLNVIKEDIKEDVRVDVKVSPIKDIKHDFIKKREKSSRFEKRSSLNNVNDFKEQLLKLNSYKNSIIKNSNKKPVYNSFEKHIYRPKTSSVSKPYKSLHSYKNRTDSISDTNDSINRLQVHTKHKIPDDPIFKEPLLNTYVRPKLSSPKYIPPPKVNYNVGRDSPTHIEFPYEKEIREEERIEIDTQYTHTLPKGSHKPIHSIKTQIKQQTQPIKRFVRQMRPVQRLIQQPIQDMIDNSVKESAMKIGENLTRKISKSKKSDKVKYKEAIVDVLKHKKKIRTSGNTRISNNIPKKVLKDLYKFSNKIDINYSL
jgi:hypothetical protein